jgi:hypothetical protein
MAEKPLDRLADGVQYPLAMPSQTLPATHQLYEPPVSEWREPLDILGLMPDLGIIGISRKRKARPKPCPIKKIFSVTLCLCGERS